MNVSPRPSGSGLRKLALAALTLLALGMPASASASIFQGETLDKVASFLAWVVPILVPIVGTRTSHEAPSAFS